MRDLVKLILIIGMMICLVGTAPLVAGQQLSDGYKIEGSPQTHVKKNTDFVYNFFVYNISNGVLIDDDHTECNFYMADGEGSVGVAQGVSYVDGYWGLTIKAGNFSDVGLYTYEVRCNSTNYGGSANGEFISTQSGYETTEADSIINGFFLLFLLGVAIFLFMFTSNIQAPGIKLFFNVLSYIMVFLAVGVGLSTLNMVQTSISFGGVATIFILGIVLIIMMFVILINQTRSVLDMFRRKKGYVDDSPMF